MDGDEPLLLVGARVQTLDPAQPEARAILIVRRRIAWLGDDPADAPMGQGRTVDMSGTTIIPAFVNAHTHLTQMGLATNAMDLATAASLAECLEVLRAIATVTPHPVICAGGWDETRWPEQRPPNADELTAVAGDRPTMLSRADGHCVVVDRTSLSALPLARTRGVERDADGRPTGLLRQEAAQFAQRWFTAELPRELLADARRAIAQHLASLGVASVHEMGGPHQMGPEDFDEWTSGEWPIEVLGYWGDLDLDFVSQRGLHRVGGSLLLDGTIGSHSAALLEPYVDRAGAGQLYRDASELIEFVTQATTRGVQVALHAIGDRAVEQAVSVFEAVAEELGAESLRRLAHRIEYAALITVEQMRRLTGLGIVVTLQPATDLDLGDAGGSYERRLGPDRAQASNPLRALVASGVPVAFGCDSIDHIDPWDTIDAATRRRHDSAALTRSQALRAATIGGRVAAHQPTVGALRRGQRADIAAFEGDADAEGPDAGRRCVLTMLAGRITHTRGHVNA